MNRRDILDEQIRETLTAVASGTTGDTALADRLIVNARSGRRGVKMFRRPRAWIAPVMAAAAVVLMAVTATELTGLPAASHPGHLGNPTTATTPATPTGTATPAAPTGTATPAPTSGSASPTPIAHSAPPLVSATTTPSTGSASGRWNSSDLLITGHSLGAVTIGMTLTEAAHAAGVPGFREIGDGVSVPTTWTYQPAVTYLYLSHASYTATSPLAFTCVGAQLADHPTADSQVVMTQDGVRLGDPASRVSQVYGSRATFVPQPATGSGYSPRAGYVVGEQNYDLVFKLNQQQTQVIAIFAGIAPATPSLCNG